MSGNVRSFSFNDAALLEAPPVQKSPLLLALAEEDSMLGGAKKLQQEVEYRYNRFSEHAPEELESIAALHIEALHGTRSPVLQSVARHGLLAVASQRHLPLPALTGEHYSLRLDSPRKAVHAVHWLFGESTAQFSEGRLSGGYEQGIDVTNYDEVIEQGDLAAYITPALALHHHFRNRAHVAQRLKEWWESDVPTDIERALHRNNFPAVFGFSIEGIEPAAIQAQPRSAVRCEVSFAEGVSAKNIGIVWVPDAMITITESALDGSCIQTRCLEELRSAQPESA